MTGSNGRDTACVSADDYLALENVMGHADTPIGLRRLQLEAGTPWLVDARDTLEAARNVREELPRGHAGIPDLPDLVTESDYDWLQIARGEVAPDDRGWVLRAIARKMLGETP